MSGLRANTLNRQADQSQRLCTLYGIWPGAPMALLPVNWSAAQEAPLENEAGRPESIWLLPANREAKYFLRKH
jgi:hypothetical protein